MSYKRHNWVKKEKVASALLNNMEQGIEAAHDIAERAGGEAEDHSFENMWQSIFQAELRELRGRIEQIERLEQGK